MVHDQSSSGSTIFVEPLSVVKLNNELRELEIREQKEIEAVLAALSNQTCDHLDELTLDLELIGELDFIFAKVICRANAKYYTVSIGLWNMLEKEYVNSWFNCFAAGAVLISIPIVILFMSMQKCYQEGVSGAVKG